LTKQLVVKRQSTFTAKDTADGLSFGASKNAATFSFLFVVVSPLLDEAGHSLPSNFN
jgi:hypothetical protein